MTTNDLSADRSAAGISISASYEPLFQSQGASGMSAFAKLIFHVVRQDNDAANDVAVVNAPARSPARSPAQSPPNKNHRPRNCPISLVAHEVQNVWCLDDILAATGTDDSTVESVLTELVIRQIHPLESKEKPDDNSNASQ